MRPPVVDWAILKIAQRCNINCTYCYVYNRGDESWRHRPAVMSDDVVAAFCERVNRHVSDFGIRTMHVEFHGGEPLLVGRLRFERICSAILSRCAVNVRFHLQTNGLLLNPAWLDLLDRFDVGFGVSLDGPPEVNDRHRIDHFGNGTADRVIHTLRYLSADSRFHRLFGGVLCVVSEPPPDGGALVEWFVSNGIREFDFLMPDGNYSNLPSADFTSAPYKKFWREVYERWSLYGKDAPKIRTISTLLRGLVGEPSTMDAHGGDLRTMIVVETDGSVGVSDVGRICPPLNLDIHSVFRDEFRAHQERPDLASIQGPPDKCKRCRWLGACGGGYLPHRYNGSDFNSPSLYCGVWKSLIGRMEGDILNELQGSR